MGHSTVITLSLRDGEGGARETVHLHPDHDPSEGGGSGDRAPAGVQGAVDLRETVFLPEGSGLHRRGLPEKQGTGRGAGVCDASGLPGLLPSRAKDPEGGKTPLQRRAGETQKSHGAGDPEAPGRGPGRRDRNQNPEDPGAPEQADGLPGDPDDGRDRVRGLHPGSRAGLPVGMRGRSRTAPNLREEGMGKGRTRCARSRSPEGQRSLFHGQSCPKETPKTIERKQREEGDPEKSLFRARSDGFIKKIVKKIRGEN